MENNLNAPIFKGIRARSIACLERFEQLRVMEGMPVVMVVMPGSKSGDPVEIGVMSNLSPLTVGLDYMRPR